MNTLATTLLPLIFSPSTIPEMSLGQQITAALDIVGSISPYGEANRLHNAETLAGHYGFDCPRLDSNSPLANENSRMAFAERIRPHFDRGIETISTEPSALDGFVNSGLTSLDFSDVVKADLVSYRVADTTYLNLFRDLEDQLMGIPEGPDRGKAIFRRWVPTGIVFGISTLLAFNFPTNSWIFWSSLGVALLTGAVISRDIKREIQLTRANRTRGDLRQDITSMIAEFGTDQRALMETTSDLTDVERSSHYPSLDLRLKTLEGMGGRNWRTAVIADSLKSIESLAAHPHYKYIAVRRPDVDDMELRLAIDMPHLSLLFPGDRVVGAGVLRYRSADDGRYPEFLLDGSSLLFKTKEEGVDTPLGHIVAERSGLLEIKRSLSRTMCGMVYLDESKFANR